MKMVEQTSININVPIIDKVKNELLNCDKRHRLIVGGRGKGASWSIARILLVEGIEKKLFIPCVREVQKTIKHSVKKLLEDTIKDLGLSFFYTIYDQEIRGANGTLFAFFGLQSYNADNIKSLEGADRCWIAEAQTISRKSINILRPTIRRENAVFWWDLNPRYDSDPVYIDYVLNDDKNARVLFLSWKDNPWFNNAMRQEMESDYSRDEEEASHIWDGKILDGNKLYVCPSYLVEQAMKNELAHDKYAPIHIGVDIAHQGGDEIVFYKRQGNKVIDSFINKYMDAVETKKALLQFIGKNNPTLIIDNGSLGMAIADDMEYMGFNVKRVNFGGNAKDTDHYLDAVTEAYFNLKNRLDEIDIPNDQELKAQLTQRKYKYTSGRRGYEVMAIETKKDFISHASGVNKSPDRADALALCFYDEIKDDVCLQKFDESYNIFG